jgi:hypothetical protein
MSRLRRDSQFELKFILAALDKFFQIGTAPRSEYTKKFKSALQATLQETFLHLPNHFAVGSRVLS